MRTCKIAIALCLFALVASCGGGSRAPSPTSSCPGGVTTDGDCCVSGCACGASCISCSSRCTHALLWSIDDAGVVDAAHQ